MRLLHLDEARRKSGFQPMEGFQKFAVLGHPALQVVNDAFHVDDEHCTLNALAVGLDRMIGIGNGAVGVGEEGEGKVELLSVVLMRLYRGGVDSQNGCVGCVELGPVVPQGLELAVSTRCVVSAVEDQ